METIAINYFAVLVCGVLAMVLGYVWYGPLFGKKWMEIVGVNAKDKAAREAMQKEAGPLYAVQFVLALLQAYILAHFIAGWQDASGTTVALWIWLGFVMPTVAAGAMWNNDSKKVKWARFWIQAGYNVVLFIIFGFILKALA